MMEKNNLLSTLELSALSIDEINAIIKPIEEQAFNRIKKVKEFAELNNVNISVDENSTISGSVANVLGTYLSTSWEIRLCSNHVTTMRKSKTLLWYSIRYCIDSVYQIANAKISKKHVSIDSNLTRYILSGWDIKLIKSFANGRHDFELTSDLLLLIDTVKMIRKNFEGRN